MGVSGALVSSKVGLAGGKVAREEEAGCDKAVDRAGDPHPAINVASITRYKHNLLILLANIGLAKFYLKISAQIVSAPSGFCT
jgi:hypothetical protein